MMSVFLALATTYWRQDVTLPETDPKYVHRNDSAMRKWRDNRFGLFVHWGLFSIPGGFWNGKEYSFAAEWIQSAAGIPRDDYAKLKDQFNPTRFNADEWAKTAKRLGAKYVTFVPKHHEGFCMWDSKYTDFDLASTPYKKDVIGPLSRALKKQGIDFYLYYSIIDWHHPDYRSSLKSEDDVIAFARYRRYMNDQLGELLAKYPLTKGLWFDGEWEESWTSHPEYGRQVWDRIKALRPNLIVNNRLRITSDHKYDRNPDGTPTGDFDSSYERKIPEKPIPWDWEACMTLPENQWGYHRHWTGHVKTPAEVIEMLVKCASRGGNFNLNFGPKPDGTFRSEEMDMADVVGTWMKTNGEAIYGSTVSGLEKPAWGYVTRKPGHLFLIVPKSAAQEIDIDIPTTKVKSVRRLGRGPVPFSSKGKGLRLKLPESQDTLADVYDLTLVQN